MLNNPKENKVSTLDKAIDLKDLDYDVRREFSFISDSITIHNILKEISDENINIHGFSIINKDYNMTLIKIVVGNDLTQTIEDLNKVRELFNLHSLKYYERDIIRIKNSTAYTGMLWKLYLSFYKYGAIIASYMGEDHSYYFETTSISNTIENINKK